MIFTSVRYGQAVGTGDHTEIFTLEADLEPGDDPLAVKAKLKRMVEQELGIPALDDDPLEADELEPPRVKQITIEEAIAAAGGPSEEH